MTQRRPIVTTDGRTFATFDLWWAEVERIATERHGPRETRYRKAAPRSVLTRNTWSDESADVGRAHAQEEDRRQAQDPGSNKSEDEAKGDTHAGAITRDHARDRASGRAAAAELAAANPDSARVQARAVTDADPRDGDDSRDRAHGAVSSPSSGVDAPPASDPHGAQTAERDDPADASISADLFAESAVLRP